MQIRNHRTDPTVSQLRAAVRERMRVEKHTQTQVAERTNISQSQLSRFLAGGGKRMTPHMRALCKYAEIEPNSHAVTESAEDTLSQLVREAIGDNPAAAHALARIVQALTPLLRQLPPAALPGDLQ